MSDGGLFSISDFAMFSRTTRRTLHHYDKIGLLSPVSRGENSYRYYSAGQLAVVNVIRTLQELGLSLAEIKHIKDNRTPEHVAEALSHRIAEIDKKIDGWVHARKLLLALQNMILPALNVNEREISVQFLPAEAIVLGGLNDYSRGRNNYDALLSFYHDANSKHPDLSLNYPVWGVFAGERVKRGDWIWPDRYYFHNPDGHDKKPAALYAVGYTRGGYGQTGELYQRIVAYIGANGFEICGDAYEEYPLNEISVSDDANYLIRVMIIVREKKRSAKRVFLQTPSEKSEEIDHCSDASRDDRRRHALPARRLFHRGLPGRIVPGKSRAIERSCRIPKTPACQDGCGVIRL